MTILPFDYSRRIITSAVLNATKVLAGGCKMSTLSQRTVVKFSKRKETKSTVDVDRFLAISASTPPMVY